MFDRLQFIYDIREKLKRENDIHLKVIAEMNDETLLRLRELIVAHGDDLRK